MIDETSRILLDATARLFDDACTWRVVESAEAGTFPEPLWRAVADMGLLDMLVPEEAGGAGMAPAVFAGVMHLAGKACLPVPLDATAIAGMLLARTSAAPLALSLGGWTGQDGRLTGRAANVSASPDDTVLVAAKTEQGFDLHAVPAAELLAATRATVAGEPRLDLAAAGLEMPPPAASVDAAAIDRATRLASLARAAMIGGALDRVTDMSIGYAGERVQFGRPIAKFQAVQQQLALLAAATASASAIVSAAAEMFDTAAGPILLDAARSRLAEVIDQAAPIAHQVHGAIGTSHEYPLQFATRRLWAWRDEEGTTAAARRRLQARFSDAGPEDLWSGIVAATRP